MAGWNLKAGAITEYVVSEDRIWSLFNFVFSDACKKRNTYKFGLIKSLLDSAFSGEMTEQGVRYSYEELFGRFAYNYWNLVVKYKRYNYQIPYVDLEFNQAAFGGICLSPTLGQEKTKKKLESALKKYSIINCITTSDIPVRY